MTTIETCERVLKEAKIILLVDWESEKIPTAFIKRAFTVFSYSPGSYTTATLTTVDEQELLTFTDLKDRPLAVDIVYIFRPEAEHSTIMAEHVLPLNAKVVWLHPPVTSAKTEQQVIKNGLIYIDGVSVLDLD